MTAKQLKKLLETHGWSQQELADELGYSGRQVRNWCAGTTPIRPIVAREIERVVKETPAA